MDSVRLDDWIIAKGQLVAACCIGRQLTRCAKRKAVFFADMTKSHATINW